MHISSCDGCGVALKRMSRMQRNAYCAFQHLMQISENFKFSNSIRKQQSYDNESKADLLTSPRDFPHLKAMTSSLAASEFTAVHSGKAQGQTNAFFGGFESA